MTLKYIKMKIHYTISSLLGPRRAAPWPSVVRLKRNTFTLGFILRI